MCFAIIVLFVVEVAVQEFCLHGLLVNIHTEVIYYKFFINQIQITRGRIPKIWIYTIRSNYINPNWYKSDKLYKSDKYQELEKCSHEI